MQNAGYEIFEPPSKRLPESCDRDDDRKEKLEKEPAGIGVDIRKTTENHFPIVVEN